MENAKSVLITDAIEAALKTIATTNGHFTNVGENVYRGFLANFLKARTTNFPLVAIQPGTERPTDKRPHAAKIELSLVLYLVDKGDNVQRLQNAVSDARRALALNADAINEHAIDDGLSYDEAEYDAQPESTISLAAMPVSISFLENYGA